MSDASVTQHSPTHDPDLATWLVAFGQRRHGEVWMNVTADELEITRPQLRAALKGDWPLHHGHHIIRMARHVLLTERDIATALLGELPKPADQT